MITEGRGIDALVIVVVFVVFVAAVGGQLVHDEVDADVDAETFSDVVRDVQCRPKVSKKGTSLLMCYTSVNALPCLSVKARVHWQSLWLKR